MFKTVMISSRKFKSTITPFKKFQGHDALTLDEVIRTLKAHEDKLKEWSIKREGKALLAKVLGKSKKKDFESSRGKGRG